MCDWLRRRLGLDAAMPRTFDAMDAPPGWRTTRGDAGAIHLSRPTARPLDRRSIMAALTAIALYAWYVDIQRNGLRSLWPGVGDRAAGLGRRLGRLGARRVDRRIRSGSSTGCDSARW